MKKTLYRIAIGFLCTVGCCVPAIAQLSAPSEGQAGLQPPSYPRLFPNPTNNNGYEEFVQAADLVRNIIEIEEAANPAATLELKRRIVQKHECARALALIREGLTKPLIAPRRQQGQTASLPLGQFLNLARLLRTEQYVDYADGRVDAALESLRSGLTFGYRIQASSLVSGLIGVMVDALVLDEAAAHLEQLSIFDCDNVVQLARDVLAADCPGIRLLDQEKTNVLKHLDSVRTNADSLLGLVSTESSLSDANLTASILALKNRLNAQPGDIDAVVDTAEASISAQYDTAVQNMRLPVLQRKQFAADASNSLGNAVSRSLTMDLQRIVDRYGADQARIRLLGVHALIRRYEWDHNTLPGSLNELKGDDLVTDPFTGDRLIYKRDGNRYTLTSAGPLQTGENSRGGAQRDAVRLR